MDLVPQVPEGRNEPVLTYAEGTRERVDVIEALTELSGQVTDVPLTIGGRRRTAGGDQRTIVAPHSHELTIGTLREATNEDVAAAVEAAKAAAPGWQALEFQDRAAVLLKAADLLAGPWRARIVAATMLGQSKTVYQAEIDAACELIDFWRFNVEFAARLLADQPASSPGVWNRLDYRPLDGFVTAITPFNFTAIAGNLPTAPALMGNTVVWKPSEQQSVAAQLTIELLEEAGLPPGVINLITGTGRAVSDVALADPDLAGIHFTGSTATFQHLWSTVGQSISRYHAYPRVVGETGGKDFVIAHPSADVPSLRTALVRGAFEYQGQKCSAASRAYIPRSLWRLLGDEVAADAQSLTMGTVTDLSHFMGAVIDKRAYDRLDGVLQRARADSSITVLSGGTADDTYGYFVRPTLLVGTDPTHEIFTTEYFGPILGIYVYDDDNYDEVLTQAATVAPYALTGSIFAQDRTAIAAATTALRFAAGNFYINDKPTGAVVGQQPFGGSRASGTNDKAGSMLNLTRWVSPRTIKETFVPPTAYRYPHMD